MDFSEMWRETRPRYKRLKKYFKILVGTSTRAGERVRLKFLSVDC